MTSSEATKKRSKIVEPSTFCSAYHFAVDVALLSPRHRRPSTLAVPMPESQGQLPQIADTTDRRIDVFDISGNTDVTGAVPASYSELLMLFAEGTSLSGSDLPLFVDATSTVSAAAWQQGSRTHNLSLCPAFQPSGDEDVAFVALDPAYDGYSVCTCNDG